MNIVPHHHHSCEAASSKIQQFFAEFHVGQILRRCNACKLRGFAVMAIIQKAIAPLTSETRRNDLIIDDPLFSCSRFKKVERLARLYNHVNGTYVKDFCILTLG